MTAAISTSYKAKYNYFLARTFGCYIFYIVKVSSIRNNSKFLL